MADNFGMKTFLYSSILTLFSLTTYAQFLIEDTEGRSTLLYNRNEAGTALFNSSEKKLEINYFNYWRRFNSGNTMILDQMATFYGSGAVKNKVAKLLEGNTLTPEATLGAAYGIKLGNYDYQNANKVQDAQESAERRFPYSDCNGDPDCLTSYRTKRAAFITNNIQRDIYDEMKAYQSHWFYIKAEYTGSKFKLFDPMASFADQISKETFNGFDVALGWNWYNADIDNNNQIDGLTSIFGLSLGAQRTNNFSSLTENTITNTQSFTNNTVSRSAQNKETVYEGTYDEFTEPYLALDWLLIPHVANKLGILLYGRWNDFKRVDGGFGFYLLKDKTNYTPKGGINIGWVEERDSDRQFQIALVTTIGAFAR